jgi:hypothetical protein
MLGMNRSPVDSPCEEKNSLGPHGCREPGLTSNWYSHTYKLYTQHLYTTLTYLIHAVARVIHTHTHTHIHTHKSHTQTQITHTHILDHAVAGVSVEPEVGVVVADGVEHGADVVCADAAAFVSFL